MGTLLGVDAGGRTGLALYARDGGLIWYRSHSFANPTQLKKAVRRVLGDIPDLAWIIVEGGGRLADPWIREGERRGCQVRSIGAEEWRDTFLYPRDQNGRKRAKHTAEVLARKVIGLSNAKNPTSLKHDAAEAVLIGLWGVLEIGWLDSMPDLS